MPAAATLADWKAASVPDFLAERSRQELARLGNPGWWGPPDLEALAELMQLAAAEGWRILPAGRGTRLDWGGLGHPVDAVISTAACDRLIEHAAADLTVTVEAGMTLGQLQTILAETGQWLPFDPIAGESSSLGALVSTGMSGSLRHRYGSLRDFLIGITFLRHDGQWAKGGGRVVKNVAGYDMMKLLHGAWGSLGLIGKLTFRTYPLPNAWGTIACQGDREAILQLRSQLVRSDLTPVAFDLLSPAAAAELELRSQWTVLLRFGSVAASVQEQQQVVELQATRLGLAAMTVAEPVWGQLNQSFEPRSRSATLIKFALLPSQLPCLLAELEAIAPTALGRVHAASGAGWLVWPEAEPTVETLLRLRRHCEVAEGFLSVPAASVSLKQQLDIWGYPGQGLAVMRAIKRQFDPQSRLAPGRFLAGLEE
ncbi:FAD-binding oxidoreductase [Synechococcus elongatus]|nr:FAD-binding oxidoreductase [Synechococcus elongatus]